MTTIRVLIADDHPVFRFGMKALLDSDADMVIVGEAGSGQEAIELASALQPDVILMDINMPGVHGIEATHQIKKQHPSIGILIVTMVEDDTVLAALRAGARGYLLKGAEGDETLRAIRTVAGGGSVFSPAISDHLIKFIADKKQKRQRPFPELTDREHEILKMMARGLTNTAIANRLYISPKTVRNYVSIIFEKLQVTSRAQAIVRDRDVGMGTGEHLD